MWDFSMIRNAIRIIKEGALKVPSEREFIAHEILARKMSKEWKWMVTGEEYFRGRQDILHKERTAIGDDGQLITVHNLPNNRHIDNVYRRMVMQKTNYLLGKPFSITSDNSAYQDALTDILDRNFMRTLKNIGRDALNCGLAWMYVYYDEDGNFRFKRFRPTEIIPEWKDADHTELDSVIRFYDIISYDGVQDKVITKVELYTLKGVDYYEYYEGTLVRCDPWHKDYLLIDGKSYNWDRLPFIAWKYNEEEQPLIVNCKSLQDGLNRILSNFEDNMEEDSRNTILVLVNYDGTNLGEFRRNLAAYGAVKVRSNGDGVGGDVKTLQVEVNSENYKAIADILKRAIIENCMGFDAKDERMSGTPNQMNIQSMYNDIDLDASSMEAEFQAAFTELLDFIDLHFANSGVGDFFGENVEIIFNTDMPMDETSIIQNIQASQGLLSDETLIAQHPWVTDPQAELERIEKQRKKEQEEAMKQYDPFGNQNVNQTNANPTGQQNQKASE